MLHSFLDRLYLVTMRTAPSHSSDKYFYLSIDEELNYERLALVPSPYVRDGGKRVGRRATDMHNDCPWLALPVNLAIS